MYSSPSSPISRFPPSQFGGLSGESKRTAGVSLRSQPVCSSVSDWLVLVNDVNCICRGLVGTSGKVCAKLVEDCGTASHLRNKAGDFVPGLYVRGARGETALLPAPRAEVSKMDDNSLVTFLNLSFESTKQAIHFVHQLAELTSSSSPEKVTMDDVARECKDFAQSLGAKTPAKRRRVDFRETVEEFLKADLFSKTEGMEEGEAGDDPMGQEYVKVDAEILEEKLHKLAMMMGNSIAEDREVMQVLGDKITYLGNEVGTVPARHSLPSTLWLAVDKLNEEVDKLTQAKQAPASTELFVSRGELDNAERRIDEELTNLQNSLSDKAGDLRNQIMSLKGSTDLSTVSYGSVTLLNMAIETLSGRLEKLDTRLNGVAEETRRLGTRASKGNSFVTVGKHIFHSIPELMVWVEKNLPEDIPFGAFVDPYSLLERISSCKDAALTSELKNMELRKKLNLRPDEAITLSGFNHSLPKYFHGSHTDKWLSGIPTAAKLLSEDHLTGVKVTINEGMESTRERIEVNASIRLADGRGASAEGKAIAKLTASDSCEFVNEVLTFGVDTNNQLVTAGFSKDEAWNLVSKLIHRIFAVDCHSRRAIAKENINGSNARELAGGVLWATFATHDVMREYRKFGIKNHPSIASEYVRFLVAHSGLKRIAKLETQVVALNESVKSLTSELQKVSKAATTAANKADQAMAAVKNAKKG